MPGWLLVTAGNPQPRPQLTPVPSPSTRGDTLAAWTSSSPAGASQGSRRCSPSAPWRATTRASPSSPRTPTSRTGRSPSRSRSASATPTASRSSASPRTPTPSWSSTPWSASTTTPARSTCATADRGPFEALIAAPGGRAVAGVKGATTWWPGGDAEPYGGLLRDIDEGYAKRIAIVIPPGAVWPLPAYELALMTAGEAQAMGQTDVKITVVTPEREPLTLFGEHASRALAEELALGRRRSRDRRRGARRRRRPDARARRRSPRRPARLRDPADRRAGARRPGVRRGGLHPHPARTAACAARDTRGPRATASPRRSSSAAWPRIRRGWPQPASPSSRA